MKLTIADVKKRVNEVGMLCFYSSEFKEFRINFVNGTEATAYYTDDREDAVNTARAMAAEIKAKEMFREYAKLFSENLATNDSAYSRCSQIELDLMAIGYDTYWNPKKGTVQLSHKGNIRLELKTSTK